VKIIKTIKQLQAYRKELSGSIGFVPTMGALHEGHLSLITQARAKNETLIVSIFVNPTQFLAHEDLSTYPRKDEADIEICKRAGVDALFMPDVTTMYQNDEAMMMAPKVRGYILEGHIRPGHFDGVLSVVLKLFNLVQPTNAYFGKKDAQQLLLLKVMVKDYFLPLNIIECETIREKSGLALSSRNVYLSAQEKNEALKISKALHHVVTLIKEGTIEVKVLQQEMKKILSPLHIEYAVITNRQLKTISQIEMGNSIILIAVRLGSTRLIDNIWV
jgi:pantoate--beta-alanine ligase